MVPTTFLAIPTVTSLYKAFQNGDNWSGVGYGVSALSGVASAFSSIAKYKLIIDWGAAASGGVALAAAVGLYIHQDYRAAWGHEDQSREFLGHAGIKPEVADKLANYNSVGRSAGPVFTQLLKESGVSPQEFKAFLNGLKSEEDLSRLDRLVERARRVPRDETGDFPRFADNDAAVKDDSMVFTRLNGAFIRDPHSLSGVAILGRELFGQRFPVAPPRP
ncbi:hypothetical protein JDN40_01775 [Rhodomicrobium vannielii ATCC 17100]|uniref:hypothetical protein n=1 Tax=Rhodomicrobium vannielii TaxID=1069 RepID=UPI00191B01EB|nr:hypothetical protein [Rhodomicrobium vannielii]MBJ7532846.1 hypothetical protein [Rhodomicrobium vannielii ATCC 17100]